MGCISSKKTVPGSQGSNRVEASLGRTVARDNYYERHSGSHLRPGHHPVPLQLPSQQDAKTDDEKSVLKIKGVDLHVQENANFHRTDRYELTETRPSEDEGGHEKKPELVVRRGQPFDITVTFDRVFDRNQDDVRIILTVGGKRGGQENKGTLVRIVLSAEDGPREWAAKILKEDGQALTIRLFTPANCVVAKWNITFDLIVKKDDGAEKVYRYKELSPVYILFNPWCSDDSVYLDDEATRGEYVLNDKGRLYRGTSKQIYAKPWNFGQFEDFMLECVMWLLDQSELSWRVRGNPVHVVRKLSALVNAPDDNGILEGNWSGEYAGGTSPLSWIGSVAIVEEYWRTKQPVKYGQCWVFSGLTTSLCRALGIPARSVTNFASAHDVDGSITIDSHWDEEGEPMEDLNGDSVWNFHVWNEVWMARPDVPSGFGGWQAIDATPQETSEGIYCCGPMSVEAIKNGLVNLPYDGPFIFAEVNADRINWIQDGDGWKTTKEQYSVGRYISTKSSSSNDRQDITNCYKFPDGSQQERTSVWRAVCEGSTRKDIYSVEAKDMTFDLIEKNDVLIGQAFDVTVKANNKSQEERTVRITLTARVVHYTGVPAARVKREVFSVKAPAGSTGEVTMTVNADEYLDSLVDMALIKIAVMARVEETKQYHCESDDFRLLKPELTVKTPEQVHQGDEYEIEMSFTNPLPRALTNCQFEVEGARLQRPIKIKQSPIAGHGTVNIKTNLKARRVGEREIIVSFDSKELADVTGSTTIKVIAPEDK